MPNMDYCKFRNTLADLRDCRDHICESPPGLKETKARKELISLCKDIADMFEEDKST